MAEKKSEAEELAEKENSLAKFLAKQRGNDKVTPEDYKEAQELLAGRKVLDLEKSTTAAEKKYTGGKVGDKYYGGGPVYPRPTKGSY
jgi:hypothetical protein